MFKQAYKFRLYPTRKQRDRLQQTLDACRILFNAALTERRDAYNFHVRQHPGYYDEATRKERSRELEISYYSQAHQLPEIKDIQEEYRDVHSQVLQDVLRRVQKAFEAFFRRLRNGEEPGYPRFQGKGRYDSFTYPQAGFSLTHDNRIYLSKIGSIKVKLHRQIKGTIKTCTIKREGDAWYVVFACEKVSNQRRDFLHKQSRKLVNAYGAIIFEELQPARMSKRPKPKQDENGTYLPNGGAAKSGLNKSIADAGWSMFQQFCVYKAANAGRTVLFVNPNSTSQICSGCGTIVKKELSERWHSCACGVELDRDHNAALNILMLGRSHQRNLRSPAL